MEMEHKLSIAQDTNKTLNGFGVWLNICWVPTVYKQWTKDSGSKEESDDLSTFCLQKREQESMRSTEGKMQTRQQEQEIIWFHKGDYKGCFEQPDIQPVLDAKVLVMLVTEMSESTHHQLRTHPISPRL